MRQPLVFYDSPYIALKVQLSLMQVISEAESAEGIQPMKYLPVTLGISKCAAIISSVILAPSLTVILPFGMGVPPKNRI